MAWCGEWTVSGNFGWRDTRSVVSGFSAPTTRLDAPTSNLQNTKPEHADQHATQPATPYGIHVPSLLYLCDWAVLMFRNVCRGRCFVQCYRANCIIMVLVVWFWQRSFLRLCIHNIYTQCMCSRAVCIHINVCTYKHLHRNRCNHCIHGPATGLLVPNEECMQNFVFFTYLWFPFSRFFAVLLTWH